MFITLASLRLRVRRACWPRALHGGLLHVGLGLLRNNKTKADECNARPSVSRKDDKDGLGLTLFLSSDTHVTRCCDLRLCAGRSYSGDKMPHCHTCRWQKGIQEATSPTYPDVRDHCHCHGPSSGCHHACPPPSRVCSCQGSKW